MEQVIRKTDTNDGNYYFRRIIEAVFGLIELVLAFRFFFKLFGANASNGFVDFIYSLTNNFVDIFEGIFSPVTMDGAETTAIFEPATLIAMVIIAIIGWAIVKFIPWDSSTHVETKERIDHSDFMS